MDLPVAETQSNRLENERDGKLTRNWFVSRFWYVRGKLCFVGKERQSCLSCCLSVSHTSDLYLSISRVPEHPRMNFPHMYMYNYCATFPLSFQRFNIHQHNDDGHAWGHPECSITRTRLLRAWNGSLYYTFQSTPKSPYPICSDLSFWRHQMPPCSVSKHSQYASTMCIVDLWKQS